jgi:hypothetical protein
MDLVCHFGSEIYRFHYKTREEIPKFFSLFLKNKDQNIQFLEIVVFDSIEPLVPKKLWSTFIEFLIGFIAPSPDYKETGVSIEHYQIIFPLYHTMDYFSVDFTLGHLNKLVPPLQLEFHHDYGDAFSDDVIRTRLICSEYVISSTPKLVEESISDLIRGLNTFVLNCLKSSFHLHSLTIKPSYYGLLPDYIDVSLNQNTCERLQNASNDHRYRCFNFTVLLVKTILSSDHFLINCCDI